MLKLFFLATLLWLLALSPIPAQAAPAALDTVVCDKAEVADIIVVAIKVSSGFKYACGNGANGGGMSVKDDVPFFVHDYTDTPERRQREFGTSEAPTAIYWSIHRVGQPLGQRLTFIRWTS